MPRFFCLMLEIIASNYLAQATESPNQPVLDISYVVLLQVQDLFDELKTLMVIRNVKI